MQWRAGVGDGGGGEGRDGGVGGLGTSPAGTWRHPHPRSQSDQRSEKILFCKFFFCLNVNSDTIVKLK